MPSSIQPSVSAGRIVSDLKLAGETLRAAQNKEDVIKYAIKIFLQLGFDRVRVWLIDQESGTKYGAKCSYLPDHIFQKAIVPLVYQNGKVLPLNYLKIILGRKPFINHTFPVLKNFFGEKDLKYSIEFPLFSSKHPLGLLSVDNAITQRPMSLKTANALMPFINQIAFALDRAILKEKLSNLNQELEKRVLVATGELKEKNAELEELVHHDRLSGLPNRRLFEKTLEEEFRKSGPDRLLTFAMVDIDFLKQINDTYGHLAGDEAIRKVGKILRSDKRVDFAARFAGDEFIVLLFNRKKEFCRKVLTDLLKKIKRVGQSISIGSAIYPDPDHKIKNTIDLMRIADDALYHAKHTGRGKLVCANGGEEKIIPLAERRKELQEIEKQGAFAIDQIKQFKAIIRISNELRRAETEKIALRKTVRIMHRDLGFKKVYICVEDTHTGKLVAAASAGAQANLVKKLKGRPLVFTKESLVFRALRTRQVIDVKNKDSSPTLQRLLGQRQPSALIIPLIGRTITLGVMIAEYPTDKHFTQTDYDFYLAIGEQIETSIMKKRALEEIKNFSRELSRQIKAATARLRKYSQSLEHKIKDNKALRSRENQIHFEIISALVTSVESKDTYTRGHSVRVATYACRIGREIGLNDKELTNLRYAGLLHDIGKVAVDKIVLNKSTALTDAETQTLFEHPVVGSKIATSVRFLQPAAKTILHHHERWDGTGYPDKLRAKTIPLESRILAIADAYDAMITRRSYGREMKKTEAIQELRVGAGKQFDPEIVKAFIRVIKKTPNAPRSSI